jgi:hypothetical protein
VFGPIIENAWLTRQSGETGLLDLHRNYRENTGKFAQNSLWTWRKTAATRLKIPGNLGVVGLFPCRREQGIRRSRTRKAAPGIGPEQQPQLKIPPLHSNAHAKRRADEVSGIKTNELAALKVATVH